MNNIIFLSNLFGLKKWSSNSTEKCFSKHTTQRVSKIKNVWDVRTAYVHTLKNLIFQKLNSEINKLPIKVKKTHIRIMNI